MATNDVPSQVQDPTEPLLPRDDGEPGEQNDDAPFPLAQIGLLCFARTIDPMAFFTIFPFINQMIAETNGIADSDVGFYSGMLESLFSLTQMMLMISWARAADRFGRKPVLIFSLIGLSIASAAFGFSRTLMQMVIFRCLAGVFSGTVVTVRVMISESCSPQHQARAFSLFSLGNTVGSVVGPLLGGALAPSASQTSSDYSAMRYAKPTIATGIIGLIATIACLFFVKETRPPKKAGTGSAPDLTSAQILRSPGVSAVLYTYGHIMMLAFAYTAVSPVFYFTSPNLGGYGFSPSRIALFLGGSGISQVIWLLVVYPPLQRRLGSRGVLRWLCLVWFIFLGATVGASLLIRSGNIAAFWALAPSALVLGNGVVMQITAIQLAIDAVSPSPAALGALNAMALAITSCIRALGPAFFTSLYTISIKAQLAGGYLFWAILAGLVALLMLALQCLPEAVK